MKYKQLIKTILYCMPDEIYLRLLYLYRLKKKLNLKNPERFTEKLQWLKLHNRNPLYTTLVDKFAVKEYVCKKIGAKYVIPTLGIWSSFDDIDFNDLPEQFVLKCTHDSGGLVICKDKRFFDKKKAKRKVETSLKRNFYIHSREWPYKNVEPMIIAEQYLEDSNNQVIDNWKFFCSYGKPFLYYVTKGGGHSDNMTLTFFDMDDKKLDVKHNAYPQEEKEIELPNNIFEMKKIAALLSREMPFVRIDFYNINGNIYFGEYTFYPDGGFTSFDPSEFDKKLGEKIDLSKLIE